MKRTAFLAALASLALPTLASAKVTFTGYGDLRYNAGTQFTLEAPPATLTRLGTTGTHATSRGFSANAIGLFASTQVQEDLQFLMDVTFKNIGSSVDDLSLQYAYLDWAPAGEAHVRGGRVTVPFGYYNENRFYAFQRYEITPPIFQSSILGLPIADWGVSGQDKFRFAPFTVEASAYVVNGYGSQSNQPTALRSISVLGGLTLSRNLHSTDNNHKPSGGARVSLQEIGGQKVETGLSYYGGWWDSSGLEPMYMLDYHLHAVYKGFDLLFETLHLGVRGDTGFQQSLGSPNWTTDGGFANLSYGELRVKGKTLAPYGQIESYRTRPNNGDSAREILRSWSAGLALAVSPQLTFKGEYLRLSYMLTDVASAGSVSLPADIVQLAAVVTF